MNWTTRLSAVFILAGGAFAWQPSPPIKQLYVEPFTTKDKADRLRDEVVAELRKRMNSVSLVSNEASADAILGGDGEVCREIGGTDGAPG
jgi:hypothetical protein